MCLSNVIHMETLKYFSTFFGSYYKIFIVSVVHSVFFLSSIIFTWTSPVLPKLYGMEDNLLGRPITDEESDLIGSLLYIGAAFGPLLVFHFVKKTGRKTVLIVLSLIVPVTFSILMFTTNINMYFICRIGQGVYVGAAYSIQPIYLADILADNERDFLMSFGTAFGYAGILVAYIIGPFAPLFYFNGLIVITSVICILLLAFGCPESPYYLIQNKGEDETRNMLMTIRKTYVEEELYEIERIMRNERDDSHLEIFRSVKFLRAFIFATTPLVMQVSTGSALIMTYTELIFLKSNITLSPSICSIIFGCFQMLTVFFTPMLLKAKVWTLKSLLLISLCGLTLSNLTLTSYFFFFKDISTLNWLPLLGLIMFVLFYNCGMEPIPWIVLGQVYPKNVDSIGSALSTTIYCLSAFPILYIFTKVDISYLFAATSCLATLSIIYCKLMFVNDNSNLRKNRLHHGIERKIEMILE